AFENCKENYMNLARTQLRTVSFEACDLSEAYLSECTFKNTEFSDCQLRRSEFLHSSLNDIDVSSCAIEGIRINLQDLRGAIINEEQAVLLVGLLGVHMKE
ncbi:MAG TPA: hypothetical protein DCX18_08770, partial [Erysipelotrichaceae bacterium]|nr:hypothetical protein [Erysipelotrichaceae bacterium]